MDKQIAITLSGNDWGQIIDGLECRREVWNDTVRYLEGENVNALIEECSDVQEARNLEAIYDRLIRELRQQISSSTSR